MLYTKVRETIAASVYVGIYVLLYETFRLDFGVIRIAGVCGARIGGTHKPLSAYMDTSIYTIYIMVRFSFCTHINIISYVFLFT